MKPVAPAPADPPLVPSKRAPAGSCDSHFHMVSGPGDFPLWDGRVEDPAPGSFSDWLQRYRTVAETLGLERGVVVHSILYGADNAVTLATVEALGSDRFRGIGLVTDDAADAELDGLAKGGVVGMRLNYVHGGVLSWPGAKALAPRLAERGLHIQMLMHAHRHMAELAPDLSTLPVPVVFDHLGWPDIGAGIEEPGFALLCRSLANGDCWVKLSAVYRMVRNLDAATEAVAALVAANPERCLWGTDWPHLMLADAEMPDSGTLLDRLYDAVPNTETRRRILVDNPAELYGF